MFKKISFFTTLTALCVVTVLFSENNRYILPRDLTKKPGKAGQIKNQFDLKKIMSKTGVVPIVVLGAGPAGLSAGLYGAAQFDTLVVAGEEPSLLTETSYVDNWLGAPHQLGADLIQKSREQAESLGARVIDST